MAEVAEAKGGGEGVGLLVEVHMAEMEVAVRMVGTGDKIEPAHILIIVHQHYPVSQDRKDLIVSELPLKQLKVL